jgi:hypothetical protein
MSFSFRIGKERDYNFEETRLDKLIRALEQVHDAGRREYLEGEVVKELKKEEA